LKSSRKLRRIGDKIPPPFPNGWFAIADSKDVKAGKTLSVDCLGENFVLFRSEDSKNVSVVDAYCPHLGAHLGDGEVKGSCIICPFHNWSFRGDDGSCVDIPYAELSNSNSMNF
jgi:cholesterol 7-desaturase